MTKRNRDIESQEHAFAGSEYVLTRVLLLLLGFGFVMASDLAYYSTSQEMGSSYIIVIKKFLIALVVGGLAALLIRKASVKTLFRLGLLLMLAAIGLLFYTHFAGVEIYGAKRWIDILGFRFQPVELFKVGLAFGLATLFAKNITGMDSGTISKARIFYLFSALIGVVLIFLQPNHSAVITVLLVVVLVALLSRIKWQVVLTSFLILTVLASLLILKDPEKQKRVDAWLFPNREKDRISLQEERFQVNRSLEAMAIGGWTGNGIGKSIIKYSLPAASTDFVFAIIVEEFGFIGASILLICFLYLVNVSFSVTASEEDEFLRLSSLGVIIFFTLNVILHVAVNLGLIPTTGVPLPFISQGGSALMFYLMSMGLILNLARRKDILVRHESFKNEN